MIPVADGSSASEGGVMMGRQRRDQGRLFYEFRLEDRIPENHLLRRMNVFVTVALADLHKELKSYGQGGSVARPTMPRDRAWPDRRGGGRHDHLSSSAISPAER